MKWIAFALLLAACAPAPPPVTPPPPAPPAPCPVAPPSSDGVRTADAQRLVAGLAARIQLSPGDEALRHPKSIQDIKTILQRDTVYLFADAATYARSLGTTEGRFSEAYLELAIGDAQLLASQVLTTQAAWVGTDLRIARANVASEGDADAGPTTDRARMLVQLIKVVEDGNAIADALGLLAPTHLARAAEVIRGLRAEVPKDPRIGLLAAEHARLRGDWADFDTAMTTAEAAGTSLAPICYLRAMEQLERLRKPDVSMARLRDCTTRFPKLVRAQAALVAIATSPATALHELAKLKQVNEDHYIVMLLEPALAAEQELARMEDVHAAP